MVGWSAVRERRRLGRRYIIENGIERGCIARNGRVGCVEMQFDECIERTGRLIERRRRHGRSRNAPFQRWRTRISVNELMHVLTANGAFLYKYALFAATLIRHGRTKYIARHLVPVAVGICLSQAIAPYIAELGILVDAIPRERCCVVAPPTALARHRVKIMRKENPRKKYQPLWMDGRAWLDFSSFAI